MKPRSKRLILLSMIVSLLGGVALPHRIDDSLETHHLVLRRKLRERGERGLAEALGLGHDRAGELSRARQVPPHGSVPGPKLRGRLEHGQAAGEVRRHHIRGLEDQEAFARPGIRKPRGNREFCRRLPLRGRALDVPRGRLRRCRHARGDCDEARGERHLR